MFSVLVKVKGPGNHGFSASVKSMIAICVQGVFTPKYNSPRCITFLR